MANPDNFELANDGNADTGAEAEATDTTNPYARKHYEIAVPDFTETDGTTHVGSSFIRIGSSFTSAEFSSTTVTDLTTDHPVLRAEKASLKLAGLVGDLTQINAENLTVETDGGEAQYPGAFLVGFADDTRYRKADGLTTPAATNTNEEVDTFASGTHQANTRANRQAETKKLLTKGGWWDHSDGNRITTTAGDKVEVIQGNYKMVVLGRQDPTKALNMDTVFITDVSGGLFQEQNACPTPCIKTVEYTSTGGVWTLFQDNGKGNVHTHYGWGDITDTYEVKTKKTQIGKWDDEAVRTTIDDSTWAASVTSKTNVSGDISTSAHVSGKIDNYTKVDGLVQNNTVAGQITSLQTAKAITNTNTAANHFNLTVGIQENINVGLILNLYASAAVSLGINATSVNGINNTYDGTKLTATLTESNVRSLQTSLQLTGNIIQGVSNRLNMRSVDLDTSWTSVGGVATMLRGMTLL
jgi:hypothetical protein